MQRMGWVIGLNADTVDEYKRLHRDVWPDITAMISACNIKNYTIFLKEPENLLFGVYDYHGEDHAADMERMAKDPATQRWWALTEPCQVPLTTRADGEWWAQMEEVFHLD